MSAIQYLTSYFHQLQLQARREQSQCHGTGDDARAPEPRLLEALKDAMLASPGAITATARPAAERAA